MFGETSRFTPNRLNRLPAKFVLS